jgi:3-oxoacyl-[acyl-carrier protein] reductase
MTGRLEGKVAIVTGASRGIGKATAELFAAEGAAVFVNYNSSEKDALEVVRKINMRRRGRAFPAKANVSRESEAKDLIGAAVERFGKIDILVNNAGVAHYATLDAMKEGDLDDMFGVNVKGTIFCTREAARNMVRRRYGKIVNFASIAALGTALPDTSPYSATKAGVMVLTKRFAFELGKSGINVNCVAPGFVDTAMARLGKNESEWRKAVETVTSRTMLNRIGDPADVAGAVLFLSSDESSFVTGQLLVVDGGRMDFLSHGF